MTFDFLQAAVSLTNLTTYTFSSQNLGTADADRYIIVCIQARAGSGNTTISTVTVGGVSASIPVQQFNAASGSNVAGIAIAAVPTGTTGNIVITFSGGQANCTIQVYRAVGIASDTPTDSGSSTAADPTYDIDVTAGGFAIGCAKFGSNATATWTGITEDDDQVVADTTDSQSTSASDEFASTQTNLTLTCNSSSSTAPVGVFASWAPSATDTVAITSPARYQIFQQDGGTADIDITGTYTGSPIAIEASWDGGAYATIDASPAGGTFSGTLTGQPTGQGTLTVRFTNDTGVSDTEVDVGVGDIFICAGQSNMSGRGTSNQSYVTGTGLKATLFTNAYAWSNLADPYDSNSSQTDAVSSDASAAGSIIPLLATQLMANLGYPVAFVPCAKGGSLIADWAPDTDHEDRTTLYGSMNYRIGQVGGCKCVLFWEGESDAGNGIAQATFNAGLDTFANAVGTDRSVQVMPFRLQNTTNDETNVNAAIDEAVNDNANVVAGPDLSDIDCDDTLHLTSTANLTVAASRTWMALYEAFYDQTAGDGSSVPTGFAGGFHRTK